MAPQPAPSRTPSPSNASPAEARSRGARARRGSAEPGNSAGFTADEALSLLSSKRYASSGETARTSRQRMTRHHPKQAQPFTRCCGRISTSPYSQPSPSRVPRSLGCPGARAGVAACGRAARAQRGTATEDASHQRALTGGKAREHAAAAAPPGTWDLECSRVHGWNSKIAHGKLEIYRQLGSHGLTAKAVDARQTVNEQK